MTPSSPLIAPHCAPPPHPISRAESNLKPGAHIHLRPQDREPWLVRWAQPTGVPLPSRSTTQVSESTGSCHPTRWAAVWPGPALQGPPKVQVAASGPSRRRQRTIVHPRGDGTHPEPVFHPHSNVHWVVTRPRRSRSLGTFFAPKPGNGAIRERERSHPRPRSQEMLCMTFLAIWGHW